MVEMFSEEEIEVDSQLGFPPVYAKLCRHAVAVELPMPFTEGAPQRFLPYSPQADDVKSLPLLTGFLLGSSALAIHL